MCDKSVLLTISLLASNRRETTEKCLDSLAPIREAIPSELIIVDTGCAPELRQELEARADLVVDFDWCSDFAKARNAGLKQAKGEWFLYLDDDEWFVECEEIIRFFRSGEYRDYGAADYIQRNFLDLEGSQYTDAWVGRMIRLDEDTRFVSRIHEQLMPVRGKCKALHAIVHHFGYVYPNEEAKQKHFERNRQLLEEMLAEEPDEIRWKLQLLLEYRGVEDYGMLQRLGETYLAEMDGKDSFEDRIYVGTFYAAQILAKLGEAQEAWIAEEAAKGDQAAGKQEDEATGAIGVQGSQVGTVGNDESAQGQYARVAQLCETARQDPRNTEWFEVFLDFAEARSHFFLEEYSKAEAAAKQYLSRMKRIQESADEDGVLFEQQKAPFVGEALDVVKQKEIYSILICTGLKRQNLVALSEYLPKLHWEEAHVYVFEKIVECLIEAMCAGEAGSGESGSGGAGQEAGQEISWHACMEETMRVLHGNTALWNYFCEEVMQWERNGNDISQIVSMMQTVAPEMFEEDSASEALPTLSAEDAAELAGLAEEIKVQIYRLIDNGAQEDALVFLKQLQVFMPEDEELIEMERKLNGGKR